MKLALFHSSGVLNFEMAPRFLQKIMHSSLRQNFGTPLLSFNIRLVTLLIDFSVQTLIYFCSARYRVDKKKLICTKTLHSLHFCSYKFSNKNKLLVRKEAVFSVICGSVR